MPLTTSTITSLDTVIAKHWRLILTLHLSKLLRITSANGIEAWMPHLHGITEERCWTISRLTCQGFSVRKTYCNMGSKLIIESQRLLIQLKTPLTNWETQIRLWTQITLWLPSVLDRTHRRSLVRLIQSKWLPFKQGQIRSPHLEQHRILISSRTKETCLLQKSLVYKSKSRA